MPYKLSNRRFMPLICSYGHQWESLVSGIDWKGAIYENPECPQCGRSGERLSFTPGDLGNMVGDDDIAEIGEAMPTFAAVLMQITAQQMKTQEWESSFLLDELAEFICESRVRVIGFLNQLRDKEFITWDAKYDQALRRVVKLGRKVRLVQLISSE